MRFWWGSDRVSKEMVPDITTRTEPPRRSSPTPFILHLPPRAIPRWTFHIPGLTICTEQWINDTLMEQVRTARRAIARLKGEDLTPASILVEPLKTMQKPIELGVKLWHEMDFKPNPIGTSALLFGEKEE